MLKILSLEKMSANLVGKNANYFLGDGQDKIDFNSLVGNKIKLSYLKEINCTACGRKTNKSYSGGYCYPCSIKLPECDMCILKPETCHFKQGTCRDEKWGIENCMIPHYVYLANSSGLKVGITRTSQVPTRFIDQGASFALPILKVGTRYQSGLLEKLISSELSDKTDWRKMLKNEVPEIDLESKREEIFEMFGDELDSISSEFDSFEVLENEKIIEINYPVNIFPSKVVSMSFDKNEVIEGKLEGIKGQYLIFDNGVINIRNHTGYKVEMEY